jgi:hypothetical protein
MAQLFIHLAFSRIKSLDELTSSLIDPRKIGLEDHVQIQIDFDVSSIKCDYLTLVVAYIKSLEAAGLQCEVDFPNLIASSAPVQHAAQIGFFQHLGLQIPIASGTKHCTCLCSDIISYNDTSSALAAKTQIIEGIRENTRINPNVAILVRNCLRELMENALAHAQSAPGGHVVCQYSPFKAELRLMVCDTGIGMFGHVDGGDTISVIEAEAIKGKGLQLTSQFANANKGELIIHSGPNAMSLVDGKTTLRKSNYWQGSYVFMRINTEQLADYSETLATTSPESEETREFDEVEGGEALLNQKVPVLA